jgi:hypothetical protein
MKKVSSVVGRFGQLDDGVGDIAQVLGRELTGGKLAEHRLHDQGRVGQVNDGGAQNGKKGRPPTLPNVHRSPGDRKARPAGRVAVAWAGGRARSVDHLEPRAAARLP